MRYRLSPLFASTRRSVTFPIEHAQKAVERVRQRSGLEFCGHDLRRTAASLMVGAGTPRLVVSKILNHAEQGVTAVYDRHSYDPEKRAALDAWGLRVMAIVAAKKEAANGAVAAGKPTESADVPAVAGAVAEATVAESASMAASASPTGGPNPTVVPVNSKRARVRDTNGARPERIRVSPPSGALSAAGGSAGPRTLDTAKVTSPERRALRDFGDRLRAAIGLNLLELRLYGAKARGEARDDAAFEVAVIVTTDRGRVEEQVVRAAFDVGTAHDVHLSPRILTPERLTDPMWRMTGFVREIERDGIRLE